jgi:hypothetical protein
MRVIGVEHTATLTSIAKEVAITFSIASTTATVVVVAVVIVMEEVSYWL